MYLIDHWHLSNLIFKFEKKNPFTPIDYFSYNISFIVICFSWKIE